MNKVCIVNVYFGKYPNYFDLFLKSCYLNPKIDFLLITDQDILVKDNVKVIKFTLSEFKNLASKKLGFEVCMETPYKLCDFKCIYGQILEDYLEGYEYWGHCDCDLIWGDIYQFLDKYEFEKYDKFLSMGHLSLYRNTKENNLSFMLEGSLVGDYKKVYTDSKNYLFDEAIGIDEIYKKNKLSFFDKPIFADIDPIFRSYKLQETLPFAYNDRKLYSQYYIPKGINKKYQIFIFSDGKILRYFYKNNKILKDEFMYIHIQKRKFDDCNCLAGSMQIIISPKGFFDLENRSIEKKLIKQYNYYSLIGEKIRFTKDLFKRCLEIITGKRK